MKDKNFNNLLNKVGGREFSFYLMTALAVLQCIFSVVFALFIKLFINSVEYKKDANIIVLYAVLLILCVLLSFAFGVGYRILHAKSSTKVELKLKQLVFSSYLKSSYKNLISFNSGDVISRLESDCQKVANTHVALIPNALSTIVHVLTILALLLFMQPIFTLILLLCVALAFIVSYFIRKIIFKLNLNTRNSEGETASFINEVGNNALFIKSTSIENSIINLGNTRFNGVYRNKLKQRVFSASALSLISLAFTVAYAITIIWAVLNVNGGAGVDYGTLIAILQLGYQIRTPIMSLSAYVPAYYEMQSSLSRLNDICLEDTACKVDARNLEFVKAKFNNVSFGYDNNALILDGVNLEILKNDAVLIKGQSGIGKSTLLKLLTGVYAPSKGNIVLEFVDKSGKTIELEPKSVKGLFGFVPQGNMLFGGSLYFNLTMLNECASDEEIKSALKCACLEDVAQSGLEMEIGSAGNLLSEGQAQRVALARALISSCKVIIFDEATSALDLELESQIIKNIGSCKDITLIAVSHKNEISKICNKSYEINSGKLA
ncbi:MAG: ABC transporter ATP-binding protein [Clostridia bacterium]|nr:ABC transporter ATP-binding protein [Clostridia bacterium]